MAGWYVFMWAITAASVCCLAVVVGLCIWMSVTYRRDLRMWRDRWMQAQRNAQRADRGRGDAR